MKTLKSLIAAFTLLFVFAACEVEVVTLEDSIAAPAVEKIYTALWYNEAGEVLSYLDQIDIAAAELAQFDLDMPALGLVLDPVYQSKVIEDLFGQGAVAAIRQRAGDGFVIRPQLQIDLLGIQCNDVSGETGNTNGLYNNSQPLLNQSELNPTEYCYTPNAYFKGAGQCSSQAIIPGWCVVVDMQLPFAGCAFSCV